MFRKVLTEGTVRRPWRMITNRRSTTNISAAVNSMLLHSLKEHYLEISKTDPPPKVKPPSSFTIMKGALDGIGPVLTKTFGNEEISISLLQLATVIHGRGGDDDDDDDDDGNNPLFLHVDVSKPGQEKSLHFFCGLYPDALGIHSVSMRPKLDSSSFLEVPAFYNGPTFEDLDERMRDALHKYLEERAVNESLFNFLQAWLYVKEHRNLVRWFKKVGTFINDK